MAAVLNADSPGVNFHWTSAQVIDAVNAALATQDATAIINLAGQLDADNNGPGGCQLNQAPGLAKGGRPYGRPLRA